jgi:hypothetical protein
VIVNKPCSDQLCHLYGEWIVFANCQSCQQKTQADHWKHCSGSGVTIPRLMFHQISSLWGLKSDVCQKACMEQKIMNVLWEGDHEENRCTSDGICDGNWLTQRYISINLYCTNALIFYLWWLFISRILCLHTLSDTKSWLIWVMAILYKLKIMDG